MHLKMSSAKWLPFCLRLNGLQCRWLNQHGNENVDNGLEGISDSGYREILSENNGIFSSVNSLRLSVQHINITSDNGLLPVDLNEKSWIFCNVNLLRQSGAYMSVQHTNIGWDNGLSPVWRQAVIWTNAALFIVNKTIRNILQQNFI